MVDIAEQCLLDLGFSILESKVYLFLLEESPSTGYKIAKALGRPVSNIYSIIKTMEDKGMILIGDTNKRLCRAIPTDELIQTIENRFIKNKKKALKHVKRKQFKKDDQTVYQLTKVDQIIERAKKMITNSKKVIFIDAFPECVPIIKPYIIKAAARNVKIILNIYKHEKIPKVTTIVHRHADLVLERWPYQWLAITVDSSETLLAYIDFETNNVHYSIWSSSLIFSWLYHSNAISDLVLSSLITMIDDGCSVDDIKKQYKKLVSKHSYPDAPKELGLLYNDKITYKKKL